jgi:hypothetical protein
MDHVKQALSEWRMEIRSVRHRWHHLSGHAETAPIQVPNDMVLGLDERVRQVRPT